MYIPSTYKTTDKDKVREFIQENSFGTLILSNSKQVPDIRDSETAKEMAKGPFVKLPQIREKLVRHIPFEVDIDSNHYTDGQNLATLTGHMAKHYPIYNCFNDGDEALLIFQGPQTYVSPTWYDNLEAATWNYISIHVYGTIERLDIINNTEDVQQRLEELIEKFKHIPKNTVPIEMLKKAEIELHAILEGETPELKNLLNTQLYKYEKRFRCDPMMSIQRLADRYKYLKKYIAAVRIRIEDFEVNVQAAFKLSQDQTPWSRNNIIQELTNSGYSGSIAIAEEMKKH